MKVDFPIPAAVPDLLDIRLDGPVGARLRDCFGNHVARTDGVALAEHFRWRSEKFLWQTEFWGKWMHSAVPFARMFGDERLLSAIDESVAAVCAAQLPDGYIGNFREENRYTRGWDVWGAKYTMLGLLLHRRGGGGRPPRAYATTSNQSSARGNATSPSAGSFVASHRAAFWRPS